jgi:hypothetical protein
MRPGQEKHLQDLQGMNVITHQAAVVQEPSVQHHLLQTGVIHSRNQFSAQSAQAVQDNQHQM